MPELSSNAAKLSSIKKRPESSPKTLREERNCNDYLAASGTERYILK